MNLLSIRIITADVKRMVEFYHQISGMPVVQYTEDFAELKTKVATMAIGSTRTLQFFGGDDVAKAAQNRSAIIEFKVDDVDAALERMRAAGFSIEYGPVDEPWGVRRFFVRDPFGKLVNILAHL